jgi:hypothetical protein
MAEANLEGDLTMTIKAREQDSFLAALPAEERSSDIPESADVYGWLIGSWALDVVHYRAVDVSTQGIKAEAHFAWALEGRAVQDVWIMPRRDERTASLNKNLNMYGTTLRVWDPSIQAWRITWINPASNHVEQQIGRKFGSDIVQIGLRFDGTPTRWRFTEITQDSFHWIGEALQTDGSTWTLEGEFLAKRIR